MKICIIGNSHVACIKSAWAADETRYAPAAVTFFASPLDRMSDLHLQGGQLCPTVAQLRKDLEFTSGGLTAVDIGAYDVFVIVGLGFAVPKLDRRLSRAVQLAALGDLYRGTLSRRIARDIRAVSAAPVYIASDPLPAGERSKSHFSGLVLPQQVMQMLSESFAADGLHFLPQPTETLAPSHWQTRPHYISGAMRLANSQKKVGATFDTNNRVHMNAEYGRLWLARYFEILQQAVPGQPDRVQPAPRAKGVLGWLSRAQAGRH